MHFSSCLSINDLPEDCISECSASGDCSSAVSFWREKLNFTVDIILAMRYLVSTGGWTLKELEKEENVTLAERVLWLACGNFSEFISECNGEGLDPFDSNLEYESRCGSNCFTMEG